MSAIKILCFSALTLFGIGNLLANDQNLCQKTEVARQLSNSVTYIPPSIDTCIDCDGLYPVDIIFSSMSDLESDPRIIQRLISGRGRVSKNFNIDRIDLIHVYVQQLLPSDVTAFDAGENGTLTVRVDGVIYPVTLEFYEPGIAFGTFTVPK